MRVHRGQSYAQGYQGANPFEAGEEDINPNAYITNLVDCMLVLAVALMVALVVSNNVKLDTTEIVQGEKVEVENLEDLANQSAEGLGYTALGTTYQDPQTGKLYLIREEGVSEISTSQTGTSDVEKAGSDTSNTSSSE